MIFPKGITFFKCFLKVGICSLWNSEEFIFKCMPLLVYWASKLNVRACPCYSFVYCQCDDAESNQVTCTDPEDISCLFLAVWHYLFGLGKL